MKNLIGPPATAANHSVYQRLQNACIECQVCGGMWHHKTPKRKGSVVQVKAGGATMAARRAMFIASRPNVPVQKGRFVSSRCSNPQCINPDLLHQTTPSKLLEKQYAHGARDRAKYTALLAGYAKDARKLTDGDVAAILLDDRKGTEAAHEYGVAPAHYNRIQRGIRQVGNPFAGLGARA